MHLDGYNFLPFLTGTAAQSPRREIFYFDDNAKGPPFGIAPAALDALLGAHFARLEDAAVPASDSLPVFRGKERWQVWQRKG